MPPSFFNEAVKMSGAGLEFSASSPETYPSMRLIDPEKVDVIFRVSLFTRTRKHDAFVVVADSLKKFPHFRKRSHFWEIFFSEQLGPVIIQFFAETVDLVRRQKLG